MLINVLLMRVWQVGLLLSLLGLLGCSRLAQSKLGLPMLQFPSTVSQIRDVQTQAEIDSTVYLRGQVGERVPLVEGQVYQLRDDTGTLWVLTTDATVQTGDQVSIQGVVRYQSIPLVGQQGERYVEEQARRQEE